MSAGVIIVTAPYSVFAYNSSNPTLPAALAAQQPVLFWKGIPSVKQDADVTGQEIIVTRTKFKNTIDVMGLNIMNRRNVVWTLPCVGSVPGAEVNSLAMNLRFNLTNKDFGPGRAGENKIGENGSLVPVDINVDHFKGYDLLPGGFEYLVAHEIAHGLKGMQEYNQQMWTQYIQGPGAALSEDQRKIQYPSSPQFKANEARANTIAKAIAKEINAKEFGFEPNNGYATC